MSKRLVNREELGRFIAQTSGAISFFTFTLMQLSYFIKDAIDLP
jgi:hypothetical protein